MNKNATMVLDRAPVMVIAPQFSPCPFCGATAGCEHLVHVIELSGRQIPVYAPSLQAAVAAATNAVAYIATAELEGTGND